MKKFLSLFAAVLFAGSMMAAESVVYTLTPASGSNNGYASNCDIVINNITWNLTGNSQMQPWRLGGKSLSSVDRTLYSKTAIESNISKISVEHGSASGITVNSWKVEVASDANFSNIISTLNPTFAANQTTDILRPNGADWSNAYYRFTYNVTVTGSSNKFMEFAGADFYAEGEGGGTPDPVDPACTDFFIDFDYENYPFSPVAGLDNTYRTQPIQFSEHGVQDMFVLVGCDAQLVPMPLLESPFTTDEYGIIYASGLGLATLQLVVDGENYALTVYEMPMMSCADVQEVTEDVTGVRLNEVTVMFVNNSNVFVKDETGMTQVYKANNNLNIGDVISGIEGKATLFNGATPEFLPTNNPADWTVTPGDAPVYDERNAAPVTALVNGVYKFTDVTFAEAVSFTTASATNATAHIGEETFTLRNNYKLAYEFAADKVYDVVGVVALYQGNAQVYFISATAHTASAISNTAVETKAVKALRNGQLIIEMNGVRYNAQGAIVR